jgi:heterotetrameric sarcosine oxidase gamma subunit
MGSDCVPELSIDLEEMHSGFATLMLRKQSTPAQLGDALGVELPLEPGCTRTAGLTLVATGPGTWLAGRDEAAPEWALELQEACRGVASISDQTGGLAAWRLSGPGARTLLQRGAFIDFSPGSFGPGSAAVTSIAHIGVTIWQTDDSSAFQLAVARSYSHSFMDWLRTTASAP